MAVSCNYSVTREGENFVAQHTLTYQISGSLTLSDGKSEYSTSKGSLTLVARNQLLKFLKKPEGKDPFRSLSIYIAQDFLKAFALEQNISINPKERLKHELIVPVGKGRLIENYLQSILGYVQEDALDDSLMTDVKLREGLLLLIKANPQIATVLFDFSEPYKIDLRDFMLQNYHFNVQLERFARLTGRSLAAFKRDFINEFGIPPGRWLTQKRLEEAYKLLKETERSPSEIYLDLGFEDLSHFSHAFKKQFGVPPSQLNGQ